MDRSNRDNSRVVACEDYEHIELACLLGNKLAVYTSPEIVVGHAVDTKTDEQGEHLLLTGDDGLPTSVRLDRISKIVVLSYPRRFNEKIFR